METRDIIKLIAEFSSSAPQPYWTAFDAVKAASREWILFKSEGPILDSLAEVEEILGAVARARNLGALFTQLVPRVKGTKSSKKPAELLTDALTAVYKALTLMQLQILRHLDDVHAQRDRAVILVADRDRMDQPDLELAKRLTGLKVMHARSAQSARDHASALVEESEGNANVRVVVDASELASGTMQTLRAAESATRFMPMLIIGPANTLPRVFMAQVLPLQAKDALLLATTDSALLRAFVDLPGFMKDGERVEETVDDVQFDRVKGMTTNVSNTQLMVSNYRLAFMQTNANTPLLELEVPLGTRPLSRFTMLYYKLLLAFSNIRLSELIFIYLNCSWITGAILRVEQGGESKSKTKGARQAYKLVCRDFRVINFTLPERAPKLAKLLSKYNTEAALESCFASAHCDNTEKSVVADSGWNAYVLQKELQRYGLLFGGKWKMVSQEEYELCPSYPLHFGLPSGFSSVRIPSAAKVRVEGRFPVLCWFHAQSGVALARAAYETSDADATLCDSEKDDILCALARANPKAKLMYELLLRRNIRPERRNALKDKYFQRALHLPSTPDFAAVFKRLLETHPSLAGADWAQRLEETGYLALVRRLIVFSAELATQLRDGTSVLVQSDDGADVAALLASLIQLQLDPYFRTLVGFPVLIEREWLCTASAVGWKGKSKRRARDEELLGGVFVTFMDCVYQLWAQQPSAFEFNEAYLLAVLHELYTAQFGTFIVTSDRERAKHKLAARTHSVWQHLASTASGYRSAVWVAESHASSPLMTRSIDDGEEGGGAPRGSSVLGLELNISAANVVLWHAYFLAYTDRSSLDRLTDAFDKATRRRMPLPTPSITINKTQLSYVPDTLLASAENVTALKRLDLSENLLNALPLSMARLTALTSLHLARNRFTAYPRYALFHISQHLHNLTEMDLSGNYLTEFYPDALVRLKLLRLDSNRLGELPPAISLLTSLTALHANNNAPLASVPWEMPDSLCVLALSGGALTKLPMSVARLTRLESLQLDNNSIEALPDDLLVRVTSLVSLALSKNPLGKRKTGSAPVVLQKRSSGRSPSPAHAVGAMDFLRQTTTPAVSEPVLPVSAAHSVGPMDFLRQTSTPTVVESPPASMPMPSTPPPAANSAHSVGPLDFLRQTSSRAVSPARYTVHGTPTSASPQHVQPSPSGGIGGAHLQSDSHSPGSNSSLSAASSAGSAGALSGLGASVAPLDFLRQTTDEAGSASAKASIKSSMSPLDFLRETSTTSIGAHTNAVGGSHIVRASSTSARDKPAATHSAESSPRVPTPVPKEAAPAAVDPLSFLRQTTHAELGTESPSPSPALSNRHIRNLPASLENSRLTVRGAPSATLVSGTDFESVLPRITSTRIASIHIAYLELTALPSRLFPLTSLTDLNLSHNKLDHLPPQIGDLTRLRTLNVESNALTRLPLELGRLVQLEEFRLNANALRDIAPQVGRLSALTLLDLSRNAVTKLPPQLGQLKALKSMPLEGLELHAPQRDANAQGLDALLGLLREQGNAQERMWRARMVVLGEPGVGKSSLVRSLLKKVGEREKKGRTDVGLEPIVSDSLSFDAVPDDDGASAGGAAKAAYRPLGNNKPPTGVKPISVTLGVFDLSNPTLATALPFCLTERTLYLLVLNLARPLSEARIESWLNAVRAKSAKNSVIIVGTHMDDKALTKDFIAEQLAELERKRSPVLKAVRGVSSESGKGIEELRAEIEQTALRLDKMGDNCSHSTMALRRFVRDQKKLHRPPIISMDVWREMAAACFVPPDALSGVTALLHNVGIIAHYSVPQLRDVVILEPTWPLEALGALYSAPPSLALGPDNLLAPGVLAYVWREPKFPLSIHALLLTMFLHFDILSTSSADLTDKTSLLLRFLLPPASPAAFPALWPHTWHRNAPVPIAAGASTSAMYARRYRFTPDVPFGFVSRLMGRLLRFMSPKCLWQTGMLLDKEGTRTFITMDSDSLSLFLHAPSYVPYHDAFAVLRQVFTVIGALIRDWYRVPTTLSFYCPHCLSTGAAREGVHEISAATVTDAVARGLSTLTCPLAKDGYELQLDRLAPDLLFVAPERMLPHSALKMQEKLGAGGYAVVYKSEYKGDLVAVKELTVNALSQGGEAEETAEKPGAREELFDGFRHEAGIMASLAHPNILHLVGYTFSPPSLVMELMNAGDLHHLLHTSDVPLTWPARMKLIYEVATAIAYMHAQTPAVLHRDLKSPNVLLARDASGNTTAKLADFGTAVVLHCGTALGRVVDNPMWLAPEVLENLEYSEAADTYAFAIIAWEAASRAEFFPELRFWTQQEQYIISGVRPPIPADTPAEFRAIIEACWAPRPQHRPAMSAVLERLSACLPSGAACVLPEVVDKKP